MCAQYKLIISSLAQVNTETTTCTSKYSKELYIYILFFTRTKILCTIKLFNFKYCCLPHAPKPNFIATTKKKNLPHRTNASAPPKKKRYYIIRGRLTTDGGWTLVKGICCCCCCCCCLLPQCVARSPCLRKEIKYKSYSVRRREYVAGWAWWVGAGDDTARAGDKYTRAHIASTRVRVLRA